MALTEIGPLVPRPGISIPSGRGSVRALRFFALYFGAMHALPIWQMLTGREPRVFAVVDTLAIGVAGLGLAYLWRRMTQRRPSLSRLDVLVLAYLGWTILSVVMYVHPVNPASPRAFLYGVHYVVFPMFGFFAVKWLKPREQSRVLGLIVALNAVLVLVGLALVFYQPAFYTEYVVASFHGEVTELWQIYGRVGSYLGSTTVGLMAGVSLLLVDHVKTRPFVRAILCAVFASGGLLSQQRGGYLAVALGLLFHAAAHRHALAKRIRAAVAWVLILGLVFVAIDLRTATLGNELDLVAYTWNRLSRESIGSGIFEERGLGYAKGLQNVRQFPLGLGLGATLSASDSGGANPGGQVVDANYMRILSDVGVPGLLLFLAVMAAAFRLAWRSRPKLLWTFALAAYAIVAVGTNIFDSFYVSHVYWTLLGILDAGAIAGRASPPQA